MFSIIAIILIIIAVVLIVLVLLQPGKGDLSASFGGISSQFGSMFGMQRTADFMTKLTRYLAIAILILILIVNKFFIGNTKVEKIKPVTEGARPPAASPISAPPVEAPKQ